MNPNHEIDEGLAPVAPFMAAATGGESHPKSASAERDAGESSAATPAGQSPSVVTVPSRRLAVTAGVTLIMWMVLLWQWTELRGEEQSYDRSILQLASMRADAQRIDELRATPQSAASRTKPNEALLRQVETAVAAAGIPRDHWRDAVPQPPVRLPKSDYRRHSTRLSFEELSLNQLANFYWTLLSHDPTLSISDLVLISRAGDSELYDTDVAVSYLVFAPVS